MRLAEQMVKEGHWLFRNRSYLPVLFILLAVISMWFYRSIYLYNCLGYEICCWLISLLGEAIRVIAVGYAADSTSGRNTKKQVAHELNATGIYSVVRNPLYLGNFLLWLGVAMLTRIPWLVITFAFIFWLYYERIILTEEAFLTGKFGNQYQEYINQVPSFVPLFKLYKSNLYRFRTKKVLRQENSSLYGLNLVFAVLLLLGNLFGKGKIFLPVFWIWVAGLSTLVYLTLWILKKHTGILGNDPMRKRLEITE